MDGHDEGCRVHYRNWDDRIIECECECHVGKPKPPLPEKKAFVVEESKPKRRNGSSKK